MHLLPKRGSALAIASGIGQQVAWFAAGLQLAARHPMPANNLLLLWTRSSDAHNALKKSSNPLI